MKRTRDFIIAMLVTPIFFYCKQELTPEFSAAGYWKGQASPSYIGILNRPNGTSRLYLLSINHDSAATEKFDGVYTVKGDFFRFESSPRSDSLTIYMETSHTASHSMAGVFVHTSLVKGVGAAFPFEVIRQE